MTKLVTKSRRFFQKIKYNHVNINDQKSEVGESGIRLPYAVRFLI
jgi:hypothetical protein